MVKPRCGELQESRLPRTKGHGPSVHRSQMRALEERLQLEQPGVLSCTCKAPVKFNDDAKQTKHFQISGGEVLPAISGQLAGRSMQASEGAAD